MKKIISIFLCIFLVLSSCVVFAQDPITVSVDRENIEFTQAPVIVNDRTLVPVRAILEAMGATVMWNDKDKTVTSKLGKTEVVMTLNKKEMRINGKKFTLEVAPQLVGNSTMVPTRAVAEGFGLTVNWEADKRNVDILTPEYAEKIEKQETFSSIRELKGDGFSKVSAIKINYFDGYDVKTNSVDGTDFEISKTTKDSYASLSVRADIYQGEEVSYTDEYIKSFGQSMSAISSGNFVSSELVYISGIEFIKVRFNADRTVGKINDKNAQITVYAGRSGGVMYTITTTYVGESENEVHKDFDYIIDEILLA
ncbi:MAG: copper amine oxidase N-terminal domain-containing protein [Clostridia bacterium]|nr:copper amine oxidase N-terminal domain-containing protein [Clostridia bacterium]